MIGDNDALYRYSIIISYDEQERKELLSCITNLSLLGKHSLNLAVSQKFPFINLDDVEYFVQFFMSFLVYTDNLELGLGYSEKMFGYKKAYNLYNKLIIQKAA